MSSTKEDFLQLVRHGQTRYVPVSEWETLSEKQRVDLISKARNTPPLTHFPVSLERKNLLRSYHSQGLLNGFHPEDFKDLSADDAEFLIKCAEDNHWLGDKRLWEYYRQTDIDTAPADSGQMARIIELAKSGYLNRLSSSTLLKLCHLSANRLIWRGELNKREGVHVSHAK